jgi:hypothetical protein
MATQKEQNPSASDLAKEGRIRPLSATKKDQNDEKQLEAIQELSKATIALGKLTSLQISNSKKDGSIRGALKEDLEGLTQPFKQLSKLPGMKTAGAIGRAINPLSAQRREAKTIKKGEKAFMESMGITPKMLKERQKLVKTEKARSIALQNESKLMQEKLGLDESEIDLLRKQRDVADAQKGDANVKDDGLLKRDVKTGKFVKNQDKKLSDMSAAMMGGKGLGKGGKGKDEGAEATEEKREAIAETEQRNDILDQIEENTRDLGKEKKVDKKFGLGALLGKLLSGIGSAIAAALSGLGGIISTALTAWFAGSALKRLLGGGKPTPKPKPTMTDADKKRMQELENEKKRLNRANSDLNKRIARATKDASRTALAAEALQERVRIAEDATAKAKIAADEADARAKGNADKSIRAAKEEANRQLQKSQQELDAAQQSKKVAEKKLQTQIDALEADKAKAAKQAATNAETIKKQQAQIDELKKPAPKAPTPDAPNKTPGVTPDVPGAGAGKKAAAKAIAKTTLRAVPVVGTAAMTIYDAIMGIINRQSNLRGTDVDPDSIMGVLLGGASGVGEGLTFGGITARQFFTGTGMAEKDVEDYMLKVRQTRASLAESEKGYVATRERFLEKYSSSYLGQQAPVGSEKFNTMVERQFAAFKGKRTKAEISDDIIDGRGISTLNNLTGKIDLKRGFLNDASEKARAFTKDAFSKMTPVEMQAMLKQLNAATGQNLTAASIQAAIAAGIKAGGGGNNSGAAPAPQQAPAAGGRSAVGNGTTMRLNNHK